jgi:tRNA(Ile)-lysidine synthase
MRGFSESAEGCGGEHDEGEARRPLIRRAVARHLLPQGEKDQVGAAVAAVLERRLNPASPRPVAVALSGGGDSVALLLAAQAWAQARGRPLLALTVDHGLQAQSAAWSEACATLAGQLGVEFRALAWDGPKPERGLPAAARAARHRLLAEAARAAGARVILAGHTADDVAEAQAMRQAGSTTPGPREWSPSPVWPQGRGLFLLRPLLGLRRAVLREWLAARGQGWIEDPANADLRYARARARAALAGGAAIAPEDAGPLMLAAACRVEPWGEIVLARAALRAADPRAAARLLGVAAVCAGGGARPPTAAARARLAASLAGERPVAASLAGARIAADAEMLRIVREAGEARRGGLAPRALPPGEPVVWDGRFELCAAAPGLEVRPLAGLARRLPAAQRRALAALPAAARPALPAVVGPAGVSCPLLGGGEASAASLVGARLRAAAGLIDREPAGA